MRFVKKVISGLVIGSCLLASTYSTANANELMSVSYMNTQSHNCFDYMDATLKQSYTPVASASVCRTSVYYYEDKCTFRGCGYTETFGYTSPVTDYSHSYTTRVIVGSKSTITIYNCTDCGYTYND